MDEERTSSIIFLVFFLLLLPFALCSLHGNDSSALICNLSLHISALCVENVTLLGDPSFTNKSLPRSSGATVVFTLLVPFQEMIAKSSVSFSKEFFFSVQGSNGPALFLSSQELLLDENFLPVELELLIISKDLLEFKNGRNRCLTVWIILPRKWIKKPVLSAKCNFGNQFPPFLYVDFSTSEKVVNATNPVIKCRSLKTFGFDTSLPEQCKKEDIVLGVYTPVLALLSIISAVFSYLKKLFTKRTENNPQIPSSETPASTQDSFYSYLLVGFHKFTYDELSVATKDFHQSEILGIGRYASVYRAIFSGSNTMYAVKRFNQNPTSKLSFEIEATAIHRLQHDKILELRGWCDENLNEPLIVYDYMPNKSLEEALRNRKQLLLWPERYKIAVGVAEALVYIHEDCSPRVIHGDVKDGNVMLDADFNPKLADFGLAMSGPPYILWRERTEQDPPECQLNAFVTEKLDVYLYGSMVLRLCCQRTQGLTIFIKFLRNLKLQGELLRVVDRRLGGNYNEEEMLRLLNVGLLCLEEEIQKRPSMKQVLQILTSKGDTEELII
ncbi:hypothetical protein IEQ34_013135 [Dendrobium chrysotoxum]|uniref:Protein kinase domain-containing protein n=1 Tax=Dendrobium chrysotoxum TaxID=161865 RepID=A0AAV7GQM2_DENCH|nr:hypothetical protein IEQ34_013135 [Dendrobium chrysotoxum]